MANKIHLLDMETANCIAAGEVAERPYLIIKEMVENSIDAGAKNIKVLLKDSGLTEIRIIDDGSGIDAEDIPLAFTRHATSKLTHIDDLNTLYTRGFRGEALASIAAVSKVTMITKTKNDEFGTMVIYEGGNCISTTKAAANVGTEIIVTDLFYNTPARKKFLVTPIQEMRSVSDIIGKLIIGEPNISFTLNQNNRRIFFSDGQGDVKSAIACVCGKNIADSLIHFKDEKVSGYLGTVDLNKSNRSYYYFFLNNRYVRSEDLNKCIEEAYHTLIPEKRFPVVFLNFTIPPSDYDINVHPNKLEVKFARDYEFLKELPLIIRSVLFSEAKAFDKDDKFFSVASGENRDVFAQEDPVYATPYKTDSNGVRSRDIFYYELDSENEGCMVKRHNTEVLLDDIVPQQPVIKPGAPEPPPKSKQKKKEEVKTNFYQSLQIIGQWAGTFILASDEKNLYMIDQHAAHERLLYNQILREMEAIAPERVDLLLPLELNLNYKQFNWVIQNIIPLNNIGFVVENFGPVNFLIRAIPHWAEQIDVIAFLTDLADDFSFEGYNLTKERLLDHQVMTRACKKAVKANQYLTDSDILYLFHNLDAEENAYTCPHGRPITIKYSMSEIRRKFLR